MTRKPSLIALANEKVPISLVCHLLGMDVDDERRSKMHCPFGEVYHIDGGIEPAFRLYGDHAYCFAGCGYFTPVRLAAWAWDVHPREAARDLLDHIGHRPLSHVEAFAAASRCDDPPDPTMLAEALKTFCARTDPHWSDRQFDPDIATLLNRCLELLPRVSSDTEAIEWLNGCKKAMERVLKAGSDLSTAR